MNKIRPFHLAFPVYSIDETIKWYTKNLSCKVGRKNKKWVDFNFFGHQISAHKTNKKEYSQSSNPVDGHLVPQRHFGIILKYNDWKKMVKKLGNNKINFIINPHTRFKNEKGEQSTLFIKDPSGNFLEFKSFKDDKMIFDN